MLEGTKGFTIIEVTIFLAISGLLLTVMFIGTGSMISRQRFTDTTDSLQTFFQSQYDEVVNGVNVSTSTADCNSSGVASGQSTCFLVGKLLTIPNSTQLISSNYIISTTSPAQTDSPAHELAGAGLKVIATGAATYELKWGASTAWSSRSSDRSTYINSVAFVRLPNSGRIVRLYYRNSAGFDTTARLTQGLNGTYNPSIPEGIEDTAAYDPNPDDTGSNYAVCVKNTNDFTSNTVRSAVLFSGQGAGAITTSYQPVEALRCSQ